MQRALVGFLEGPSVMSSPEVAIGLAAAVTLIGVRFCWNAPRNRMSIEERAKDGKLTEEQARRRIQVIGWRGPVVTFLGLALLAYAILR